MSPPDSINLYMATTYSQHQCVLLTQNANGWPCSLSVSCLPACLLVRQPRPPVRPSINPSIHQTIHSSSYLPLQTIYLSIFYYNVSILLVYWYFYFAWRTAYGKFVSYFLDSVFTIQWYVFQLLYSYRKPFIFISSHDTANHTSITEKLMTRDGSHARL